MSQARWLVRPPPPSPRSRGAPSVGEPALEVGGGEGEHVEGHLRVAQPAELGTDAAVHPGVVEVEVEARRPVGEGVALEALLGNPEGVDYVAGSERELDGLAGGDREGRWRIAVADHRDAVRVGPAPAPLE